LQTEIADIIDRQKYREEGESFADKVHRISNALSDNPDHKYALQDILFNQRFLPAGRIQNAVGASRVTTAFNCYVSGTIDDDFSDIYDKLKEAGETMRKGGGIGYDFSTLRPRGSRIKTLSSTASGPLSFMDLYDAGCATVLSAGHRRGAQMGVMRVDHPDILSFVRAKNNNHNLLNFNISVGITDDFMNAVEAGESFDLKFNGEVYDTVDAEYLWEAIMRSTWDWAEPGVLFLDTINRKNNLGYCEKIAATNPCGEQPLPPYGACLLGSVNLTAYLRMHKDHLDNLKWVFYENQLRQDLYHIVRAMDNVIDRTIYPLHKQRWEAMAKRRMGIGVTGVANTMEMMGMAYGTEMSRTFLDHIMKLISEVAYEVSIGLAMEKGAFPALEPAYWETEGTYVSGLSDSIRDDIAKYGIRNSHLLSVAPTGTISLTADNVSAGIEPPFKLEYNRPVYLESGEQKNFVVKDWAYNFHGVKGRTSDEISVDDHVNMLITASKNVDSSVSKTCNVGKNVTFEDFKDVYMKAYNGGASGCTTFREDSLKMALLTGVEKFEDIPEGSACYIDPDTGQKECS
jgi:ribonucleoside-diphosphate reductase alpha chain